MANVMDVSLDYKQQQQLQETFFNSNHDHNDDDHSQLTNDH